MFETGGSLWVPIVIIGPVLLALAMIYGIMRWRRSPSQQRASDEQTKRLYQSGETGSDRV